MARSATRASSRLKRRRNQRRGSTRLPRGFAMGIVLLVSIGVLGWHFRPALMAALESFTRTAGRQIERPQKSATKVAKGASGKTGAEQKAAAAEAADRFTFYDMLPDARVEVTEQTKVLRTGVPPPVSEPGTYVVQAGAFPDFAAADKVKARLALLGVVSEIQTADANGVQFHRVRIGPIESLDELNRLRARLRQNGIEHQVTRVGD